MDILLIAGMWLDASAWDDVVPAIERAGHHPIPVTLPGQGDGDDSATYDDQVAAVVAALDAASDPVLVVGHSAACSLAWVAADARPDRVSRVVMIGGFGVADGETYFGFFEPVDGKVPFPGWQKFEGPDSDDLSEDLKAEMERESVAVPATVTQGVVSLTDERRYDVPVTLVCPEFSIEQGKEWVASGDVPELAKAKDLTYVDIDSGHWPMYSCPEDLAEVIVSLTS